VKYRLVDGQASEPAAGDKRREVHFFLDAVPDAADHVVGLEVDKAVCDVEATEGHVDSQEDEPD